MLKVLFFTGQRSAEASQPVQSSLSHYSAASKRLPWPVNLHGKKIEIVFASYWILARYLEKHHLTMFLRLQLASPMSSL